MAYDKENKNYNLLELQIRSLRLPPYTKEYVFCPGRRFRFDWAWPQPELRVSVEYEGGTWGKWIYVGDKKIFVPGRHNTAVGYSSDCEKYALAAIHGWIVIRCTADMVQQNISLDLIRMAFMARKQQQCQK